MEHIVQTFKALADENRLKILVILSRRRICAKGLAKHLEISEAAVSQHIKILKNVGIIIGHKVGYFVHYELQEPLLFDIVKFVEQVVDKNSTNTSIQIPNECRASCNTKNRCCKNKIRKE